MALNLGYNVANFAIELDGQIAGHLASVEVGALKAEAIEMPHGADIYTSKSIGNIEYASCVVTTGISESQAQLDWISSIWKKDVMEKSGAILLANQNFEEKRRANFSAAYIEEWKIDDCDANGGGKKPLQMTYKFAPEMLEYVPGGGAKIASTGMGKQKQFSANNFRCSMGGLPCDRVTKISGISVTSEVAKEYQGRFRTPTRHQANIKFGDVTFEISGDDKSFNEWNKYAKTTLQDGVCTEAEDLTCVIEWLDQSLKKTVATLTLVGCGIKEFKMPKFEHGKSGMATFTAVFNVEGFGPDGFKLS